MDPRYSGRLSPPRRYAAPGRNSTGRIDTDYESYYQPRGSNNSITSGPRTSAERIIPRTEPRLGISSRTSNDDYYVAPRYPEGGRRPLSIITPAGSSSRYRPAVSSAADIVSAPYSKSRGREDESFYIQPAASGHGRHFSMGSNDLGRYSSTRDRDRERDRDRDLPTYRSSGPKHGEYLSPAVPTREAREWDRDYEYSHRDQLYRNNVTRPRTRRVSDLESRDRPASASLVSIDDYRRQQGPPVTTRGLLKIEDDGIVQREYRYPRDEPRSRDSSLHRSNRDERDRVKPSRGMVTVHQDDGYSSSTDLRSRDKSHRHRRHDSVNRERNTDEERRDEPVKKHHGTDHDERHHRSHRHRDEIEEHRGSRDNRDEGHERDDDRERSRRSDEPRKSKHGDRKLAEGAAIGAAAAVGAGGLVAEGIKHRHERDGSEIESDTIKDRSRRHRHKEDSTREKEGSGSNEGEEDRRERRRRRRREREERERRDRDEVEAPSDLRAEEQNDRDNRPSVVPIPSSDDHRGSRSDEAESRNLRRHDRHRRDRGSSSDTESSSDAQRVRVVSPARDASRKPKSILRQPTQKFPEDPAPIREGVAPMKNSGKKGIPPDARWTRISRKLVNPEALELAQERYEESDDTVVVLRVLTKDEIEKYAFITQELRCKLISIRGSIILINAARRAAQRPREEEEEGPRAIDDRPYNEEFSSFETPKQITAQAYSEHEKQEPQATSETAISTGEDEQDRPSLQKEASYQRLAPPGYQPQSNIPVYPTIPGRSSAAQSTTSSSTHTAHDPTYPSQGGGYKPANTSV